VREGRVDRHAAYPGSTALPDQGEHAVAEVEEPLRLDAEVLEGPGQLAHGLGDAAAAVEDRLPAADVGRLDVLDVGCPQVEIELPDGVEDLVAVAQSLDVLLRDERSPRAWVSPIYPGVCDPSRTDLTRPRSGGLSFYIERSLGQGTWRSSSSQGERLVRHQAVEARRWPSPAALIDGTAAAHRPID
jgi:hypothetical protein